MWVLFSDLVGFTNYCDQHDPEAVVRERESLFSTFESCARRHGLAKIKTLGDAFLATAGLLEPVGDPVHGGELRAGYFRRGYPERLRMAGEIGHSHRTGNGRDRRTGTVSVLK